MVDGIIISSEHIAVAKEKQAAIARSGLRVHAQY